MSKLNVKALGLTFGILWSASVLILGLLSMAFDWGTDFVETLSSLYFGYEPTILGSVIGAAWGFVDGFIFGVLVAWLYNLLNQS